MRISLWISTVRCVAESTLGLNVMYLHKSFLNGVRIQISSLSLQCTWITWNVCQQNTVLRRNFARSVSGKKKEGNLKKVNKGGARGDLPTCFAPYFTDIWFILSQSTHAAPHTAASLEEQRPLGQTGPSSARCWYSLNQYTHVREEAD